MVFRVSAIDGRESTAQESCLNAWNRMLSKLRFLRKIATDPMTGPTDWGMHSVQDDPDSDSWHGNNVFYVYTKSTGTALDGTKYKDW